MKEKKGFLIGLFILLFLICVILDNIFIHLMTLIRVDILTNIFLIITNSFFGVFILILIPVLVFLLNKKNEKTYFIAIGLFLAGIINFLLKITVKRIRPFETDLISTLPSLAKNSYLAWNSSFPSFHAMFAFFMVPILVKEYPKSKSIWWSLAFLIAFSRIYFGLHFLSDSFVGGVIGYGLGYFIVNIKNKKIVLKEVLEPVNKFFKKI